jgi:hypothetical protein
MSHCTYISNSTSMSRIDIFDTQVSRGKDTALQRNTMAFLATIRKYWQIGLKEGEGSSSPLLQGVVQWVPTFPTLWSINTVLQVVATPNHKIILLLLFFFLKSNLFYVCEYIVTIFRHTRRGHQISLQMVVSHHVVAGNWTQDLWKSRQYS